MRKLKRTDAAAAALCLLQACSLTPPEPAVIEIDRALADLRRGRRIASGLANPRAMQTGTAGVLLVATAGSGREAEPNSGAVLRMRDLDGDGRYDSPGERRPLLKEAASVNIVDLVKRDEVFGMSALARGGGRLLASVAFFDRPSELWAIENGSVELWATVDANINDLVFDPKRGYWFAVSSSKDELLRLDPDGRSEVLARFDPLEQGQDPVPGYIALDRAADRLLVSLFSGSTEGDSGGTGTEFVRGAGRVVAVDPDTGTTTVVARGLTAPTDLLLDASGKLLLLEFCDGFLEPVAEPARLMSEVSHGGFRRFSGRLLSIDLEAGSTRILARGLDTPTNLLLDRGRVLVSQGMGTPGRPIPGPRGRTALDGFIEAFDGHF